MTYRTYIVTGKSKIHKGLAMADLADADLLPIKIKKWEQISLSISSTLVWLGKVSEALTDQTGHTYCGMLLRIHANV